jgi:hypothetical protein
MKGKGRLKGEKKRKHERNVKTIWGFFMKSFKVFLEKSMRM